MRVLAACLLVAIASSPVLADEQIPGHAIDRPINGVITGVAALGALGFSLIPVAPDQPVWSRQILGIDDLVTDNFSRRASTVSDILLLGALASPVFYLMGTTIDDADGDRLLLYGETMLINGMFAQAAKHIVQRPRPYLYSSSPSAKRFAKQQGRDAYKSFYSGHAAMTFGAAVSGAYLLAVSEERAAVRQTAWGVGLGVAAATANLRVRAGRHFYSDVLIGTVIGGTVGYLVPALHADDDAYTPTGGDILFGVVGIAGGLALSQLLPLEDLESDDPARTSWFRSFQLTPTPLPGGMGLSLGRML